ncbi:MAG: hypothetical protein IPG86_03290 [Chitinophagaceae bacterium]|nr:hypothetical protein [Chitinophagaceae bacterium]
MDLNHINLPPAALASLYGETLVSDKDVNSIAPAADIKETPPTPNQTEDQKPAVRSLGNNQQQILVLVNVGDAVFLSDESLGFLTGVLSACKLSMADIALVNLHHYPDIPYQTLLTEFKSRIVLLFDKDPASFGLPMKFPHYQLQAFAGNTFLYAPSLQELEKDKVEKSKLWVCLKRLFNL